VPARPVICSTETCAEALESRPKCSRSCSKCLAPSPRRTALQAVDQPKAPERPRAKSAVGGVARMAAAVRVRNEARDAAERQPAYTGEEARMLGELLAAEKRSEPGGEVEITGERSAGRDWEARRLTLDLEAA
jgi:hypothetical protein